MNRPDATVTVIDNHTYPAWLTDALNTVQSLPKREASMELDLVSTGKAAEILGVTNQAINKMRDRNELRPFAQIDTGAEFRQYVYLREDVLRLKRERESKRKNK